MTPQQASKRAAEICRLAPVVPVLVVEDVTKARPLAEALVAGGLPALEVTLRTPAALAVIREMAKVKGGVVGAGTLITPGSNIASQQDMPLAMLRFNIRLAAEENPALIDRVLSWQANIDQFGRGGCYDTARQDLASPRNA